MHENSLGPAEERRIDIIMAKIASLVNIRQLILRPFFQDYELVTKKKNYFFFVYVVSHTICSERKPFI